MNKLLPCSILVSCLFIASEATDGNVSINFLGIKQRFNSSYYDSYYCCSLCSNTLVWLVNNEDVVLFNTGSTVGDARRMTSAMDPNISFITMILSNETLLDSIMIATQTDPNWRPNVVCRGSNSQRNVSYAIMANIPFFLNSDGFTTTEGAEVNHCATHISICHSFHMATNWSMGETFIAAFNASAMENEFTFRRQSLDPTKVLYEALLLERNDQGITSVIIWNDFSSTEYLNVTCNNVTVSNPPTTTDYSSTVLTDQSLSSTGSPSISNTTSKAGSSTLSPYLASTALLIGISMICKK